jgi:hypothetical protein
VAVVASVERAADDDDDVAGREKRSCCRRLRARRPTAQRTGRPGARSVRCWVHTGVWKAAGGATGRAEAVGATVLHSRRTEGELAAERKAPP